MIRCALLGGYLLLSVLIYPTCSAYVIIADPARPSPILTDTEQHTLQNISYHIPADLNVPTRNQASITDTRDNNNSATDGPDTNPENSDRKSDPTATCNLDPGLVDEIDGYQEAVDRIIDFVVSGQYQGVAYTTLGELVDTFGPRLAGSHVLEEAIDWVLERSREKGLDNVHPENVTVPHWVRSEESATLLQPRHQQLHMLGLGSSVGTPPQGITAPVLVVKDFQELQDNAAQAAGKIVVYNQEYVSYGTTVQYRSEGASRAAEVGAVAALVRSVTPFSIASPHTGMQFYQNASIAIPVACITVEDAAMMQRMQARGQAVVVQLVMEAHTLPDVVSRNTVVELQGASLPHEVVLVSGHLDSWDVGQGAMDDGGGAVISWLAPEVLKLLGLRPRRTLRAVLWTAEEQGGVGASQYYARHQKEHDGFQLIMESDIGTFTPLGLRFTGTEEATCVMRQIMNLMTPLNATQVLSDADGTDILMWKKDGVPLGSLHNANDRYFWFHHSDGDTMSVEDPGALDRCLALWTAVSYVTADMSHRLPHEG